jgi:hypothetical protein
LGEQGKHTEAVKVFAEFFRENKGEGSKADSSLSMKQPKEEGDGADEEEVDKTSMQVSLSSQHANRASISPPFFPAPR